MRHIFFVYFCSLGAMHDGRENGCGEEDGYLMSAQPKNNPNICNINKLSSCTVNEIRIFLGYVAQ